MPSFAALLLLAAAAAAVVDWAAVLSGGSRARVIERVAKPLVPVLLAASVVAAPAAGPVADGVRPWVLLALAASLVGDVLLLPPGRLVGGLVAFLVAHVAYLGAFVQLPGSLPWLIAGALGAVVLAATVGRALVRAAHGAGLGLPVAVYLVAICAMAVAATRTGELAAIVGAWLFVASDSLLGWSTFRPEAVATETAGRQSRLGVIVTYHLAQLLLVVALMG